MKKSSFFYRVFIYCVLSVGTSTLYTYDTIPSWNIFIYMEPSGDLYDAALKNINDLAKVGQEQTNVFVLLHAYGTDAWLYKIEKNSIKQLCVMPVKNSPTDAIIGAMTIVTYKFPAQHNCFILWDHGFGILVPRYNEETEEWEAVVDDLPCDGVCPLKRTCLRHDNYERHKGMLINSTAQTCFGNQDMIELFDRLCTDVLNKKIDICGLDMCKGAMVEHAYQLRNYVDYLIGSQECELTDGWPYDLVMTALNNQPNMYPRELAKTIVNAYDQYYERNAPVGIYTQSAIDVRLIAQLKNCIDTVAVLLGECFEDDVLRELVHRTRSRCRKFCDAPMYMDLYCFFSYLMQELQEYNDMQKIQQLVNVLQEGCGLISRMIIANATGSQIHGQANGISIYYPFYTIDSSYLTAPFAQESSWFPFIEKSVADLQASGKIAIA